MRWVALFSALLTAGCAILSTGPGHIDKVLVHYLDGEGRHARGGTLLDRDIFQRELRDSPSRIAAVRFDIKWAGTALDANATRLRVEIRGTKQIVPIVIEQPAGIPRQMARWTGVALSPAEYQKLGALESWRVSLIEGNRTISHQQSFLW